MHCIPIRCHSFDLSGSRGDKAVPRTPGPQVAEEEQLREIEALRSSVRLAGTP